MAAKMKEGNSNHSCFMVGNYFQLNNIMPQLKVNALQSSLDLKGKNIYILPATTVTVITDHSNLQFIHSSANKRVQRWAIALSEFHFDIVYSPGQGNEIADMLSRLLPDTSGKKEEKNMYKLLPLVRKSLKEVELQ